MPLIKIQQINESRSLIIWNIKETEDKLLQTLDLVPNEIELLKTFKHKQKRLEWISARIAVKALAKHMSVHYNTITKDANGKPLLDGSTAELALSHSYPYVCAIIDYVDDVGIDLEQPKDKLKLIAHKFLSQTELNYCGKNTTMLCILWSAKETLYKIYSKRGLTFKDHLHVEPFELSENGTITGHIKIADWRKKYKLDYYVADDYVMVYNID